MGSGNAARRIEIQAAFFACLGQHIEPTYRNVAEMVRRIRRSITTTDVPSGIRHSEVREWLAERIGTQTGRKPDSTGPQSGLNSDANGPQAGRKIPSSIGDSGRKPDSTGPQSGLNPDANGPQAGLLRARAAKVLALEARQETEKQDTPRAGAGALGAHESDPASQPPSSPTVSHDPTPNPLPDAAQEEPPSLPGVGGARAGKRAERTADELARYRALDTIFERIEAQVAGIETRRSWGAKNAGAFKTLVEAGSTIDAILAAHDRLRAPDGQRFVLLTRLQGAMIAEKSAGSKAQSQHRNALRKRQWWNYLTGETVLCTKSPYDHGLGSSWGNVPPADGSGLIVGELREIDELAS